MMNNQCAKDYHDLQKVKYLCIDSSCNHKEKLGCADCFLQDHSNHQRVHTEEFVSQAASKIKDLKTTQCEGVFKAITELNETIDQEFETCAGAIIQRFDNVKAAIKQSVEIDAQILQSKQDELNQEIDKDALQISSLIERPIYELSDEQILRLTSLCHDFPNIQSKHQASLDQLRSERDLIKLKKQKHLRKLNQVVNSLLREFGDKLSPEKDTDNEACATPEKIRIIVNQQNSQTKSPPTNIVEYLRQGRRGVNLSQQNKKFTIKKRIDE